MDLDALHAMNIKKAYLVFRRNRLFSKNRCPLEMCKTFQAAKAIDLFLQSEFTPHSHFSCIRPTSLYKISHIALFADAEKCARFHKHMLEFRILISTTKIHNFFGEKISLADHIKETILAIRNDAGSK